MPGVNVNSLLHYVQGVRFLSVIIIHVKKSLDTVHHTSDSISLPVLSNWQIKHKKFYNGFYCPKINKDN